MNRKITVSFVVAALLGCVLGKAAVSTPLFDLTILHINDVHSRFEQFNKYGGSCTDKAMKDKCFGGYARLVHESHAIRKTNPNTIFLNAGDFFQGTIFYTIKKWKIVKHFNDMLNLTAMSLGNHEFDDGIPGLLPFVNNSIYPILAANINTTGEPSIHGLIKKSVIVNVGGHRVGIIGYITKETSTVSRPGPTITFLDEVESIQMEADRLKDEGVKIVIAVGHAGYLKDMEIAQKVTNIDVVVGGHTNTFLWTGQTPVYIEEKPMGPYPTVVNQTSGRQVPVVQAYAFGKYLGNLTVSFDEEGEVVSWSGLPILMNNSIPQNDTVLNELTKYKKELTEVEEEVIGRTTVFLDGEQSHCRMMECNLGNLITDAYVDLFVDKKGEGEWSKAAIALLNGGAVRNSIDEKAKKGNITYGNVMGVAPFPNSVNLYQIKGSTMRKMFEYSVGNYDILDPFGGFLQVSGIQVVYNLQKPKWERVVELKARCNRCKNPTFHPVNPEEVYDVVMTNYLAEGGDGYKNVTGNLNVTLFDFNDADSIIKYIKKTPEITHQLEGRITIVK